MLRQGESHAAKPGVADGLGVTPLPCRVPSCGNMQSSFGPYCGLAAEGRSDEKGQPLLLQVAASLPLWGMYLAGPPIPAQRLFMAVLWAVAWLHGYRLRYERFEQGQREFFNSLLEDSRKSASRIAWHLRDEGC